MLARMAAGIRTQDEIAPLFANLHEFLEGIEDATDLTTPLTTHLQSIMRTWNTGVQRILDDTVDAIIEHGFWVIRGTYEIGLVTDIDNEGNLELHTDYIANSVKSLAVLHMKATQASFIPEEHFFMEQELERRQMVVKQASQQITQVTLSPAITQIIMDMAHWMDIFACSSLFWTQRRTSLKRNRDIWKSL